MATPTARPQSAAVDATGWLWHCCASILRRQGRSLLHSAAKHEPITRTTVRIRAMNPSRLALILALHRHY